MAARKERACVQLAEQRHRKPQTGLIPADQAQIDYVSCLDAKMRAGKFYLLYLVFLVRNLKTQQYLNSIKSCVPTEANTNKCRSCWILHDSESEEVLLEERLGSTPPPPPA